MNPWMLMGLPLVDKMLDKLFGHKTPEDGTPEKTDTDLKRNMRYMLMMSAMGQKPDANMMLQMMGGMPEFNMGMPSIAPDRLTALEGNVSKLTTIVEELMKEVKKLGGK